LKSDPVGKCGIFCGACRLYILAKCKGCFDLDWKKIKCSVYRCAENKGIDSCGKCQEFPCLEHYSSDQVYAKKKLLNWKQREIVDDDKKSA
jgi:hypothetical protein